MSCYFYLLDRPGNEPEIRNVQCLIATSLLLLIQYFQEGERRKKKREEKGEKRNNGLLSTTFLPYGKGEES